MKKITAFVFFVLTTAGLVGVTVNREEEKPLPSLVITPLTAQLYVFTTYQMYRDIRYPANGLYAVSDSGVIMIDCPWDTTQAQPLLDTIAKRHKQKVKICIATHHHDDRTGSFEILKRNSVATYTSELTYQWCVKKNEQKSMYRFKNDTIFTLGGLKVETFYPGAGHAQDNIVVWFTHEKVLYGGCFIKSTDAATLGNLADANVAVWPASLKKVQKKFQGPAFVIPGHERWNNKKSIAHTLKLLKKYNRSKK